MKTVFYVYHYEFKNVHELFQKLEIPFEPLAEGNTHEARVELTGDQLLRLFNECPYNIMMYRRKHLSLISDGTKKQREQFEKEKHTYQNYLYLDSFRFQQR